ncbi:hypothetical protein LEP1GSC175_3620 [Leptospira santarosai str. HAI821]|uniref:Uncharacterized protein n=2 Tax=Leptospira santarosai TaxID=28183 RepID=K8Y6W5_9LEPT|nr:hypothetical protein LEP1GSC179_2156 [Leptospira santarosai str. MOR084]EKT88691.1 hypothetical protein LSS_00025 [Leptospira santarosai serovar Shermani str. LT 821]EMO33373.1 hypothetical protein LEP1GSC175_3620 [Leptospira santarosai str. HAI821]EPG81545.1 hypothetical protein LEP1GSC048_1764 [Leptospira santarosai serovar Shermani str. 1342KT]
MNQGNEIPDRSCVHSKFTINRLQSFGKNAGVPTNYVSLGFVRTFERLFRCSTPVGVPTISSFGMSFDRNQRSIEKDRGFLFFKLPVSFHEKNRP